MNWMNKWPLLGRSEMASSPQPRGRVSAQWCSVMSVMRASEGWALPPLVCSPSTPLTVKCRLQWHHWHNRNKDGVSTSRWRTVSSRVWTICPETQHPADPQRLHRSVMRRSTWKSDHFSQGILPSLGKSEFDFGIPLAPKLPYRPFNHLMDPIRAQVLILRS